MSGEGDVDLNPCFFQVQAHYKVSSLQEHNETKETDSYELT